MQEKKIEGLLLQTIQCLGTKKILKILTPTDGLITVLSKNKPLEPFTHPFLIAEWIVRPGKSEIHLLKDATLINDLADLRKNYTVITTAGLMAKDLLKSQWPEKPGKGPYLLAVAFFQKLTLSPETLLASFRLKLLLHDGHMGEEFPIPLTFDEQNMIHTLTFARQFHLLQSIKIEKTLQNKIEELFLSVNS